MFGYFKFHYCLQQLKWFPNFNFLSKLFLCLSFVVPDIKYEISGGNVEGTFAVNSKTGEIYVDRPLDFETKQKVTISNPDKTLIY